MATATIDSETDKLFNVLTAKALTIMDSNQRAAVESVLQEVDHANPKYVLFRGQKELVLSHLSQAPMIGKEIALGRSIMTYTNALLGLAELPLMYGSRKL